MLRLFFRVLSTAGLLALDTTAQSRATPQSELRVSVSPDGETLYLVGMLLDGAYQQVDAALRKAPRVRQIHLSSAGGFTIEGRLVAALVRKHRLDTYVEYYCASACTQVFAAGRQRVLGPQARLGFHQAVVVDRNGAAVGVRPGTDHKLDSTLVFGINGNDSLRLAYELAGTKTDFIAKALSYDYDNMWLPDQTELLESGLVTRLAGTTELPVPADAISRLSVRAAMLQYPFWQAALVRLPQVTEQAIDEVWRAANSGSSLATATQAGRAKLVHEAAKLIAQASDPILDRALTLYGQAARRQREESYPSCDTEALGNGPTQQEADFSSAEDALLTEVLHSTDQTRPMKPGAASDYFRREVLPLLSLPPQSDEDLESSQLCRIGFATFEAIDAMPADRRLKAYRALLAMAPTAGN